MSIKTVETENMGLKRAYTVTIPAKDIDARVDGEIKKMAPQVRMPGFRPGKVPPNLIRKMHGEALMRDALQSAVQDSVQQLISDKSLRPAMQPEVELGDDYEAGKDAEIKVTLETLPEVPKPKIDKIKLERLTAEADDQAVDEQLKQLASGQQRFEPAKKGHKAKSGDQVVIDTVGTIGGKAFDGGTLEAMPVTIGSGTLIPGFEEQLVGAAEGDDVTVKVTFPKDYQAKELKGKAAEFACSVKEVKVPVEAKVDDDFAKSLGLNDLDQLRSMLKDQQQQELNGLTRTHMKRRLLDQLAEAHDFDVPPSMVDAEFEQIMAQLRHEASHEDDADAALKEIEGDSAEYRKIAERRVRLGLLLSEIGTANGIDITQQEMNRLIGQAAAQYRPQDRDQFIRYVQENPMAAAQLRAPLFEDKVVDYLFEQADVKDRKATRAEIEADLESEEGHVHGPGCGHDHAEAKPKKAAAKAKPAAKAKAEPEAKPVKAEPKKPSAKADAKPAAKKAPAKKAAPKAK